MKRFVIALLCMIHVGIAQDYQGSVGTKEHGEIVPMVGVSVYWAGTNKGTTTNEKGEFSISAHPEVKQLVFSFLGFAADTIEVSTPEEPISIQLKSSVDLDEVVVEERKSGTSLSFMETKHVLKIDEKELEKAACCNLSESFETNPAVDVSFTDAVTGTRQIQLLGLAGPNTQITREQLPNVRGLASVSGLTYIPGAWVRGINLTKGTGSVVNGFESIAGQIDVTLRQPQDMDRIYLNAYVNQGGRVEGNANIGLKVNDNWTTAILLHASGNQVEFDNNEDDFLDLPLRNTYIALNRWRYQGDNGLQFQVGVKGTFRELEGGQTILNLDEPNKDIKLWKMENTTKRIEGWAKSGKVLNRPNTSFGIQMSGIYHDHYALYGDRIHDAVERTGYFNFIYQSQLWNENHTYKAGVTWLYDDYEETLDAGVYDRTESVQGAYVEYTQKHGEKWTMVLGLRGDYHNLYGFFGTPRLHARYAITDQTVVRFSAGRGQRTANVIAENMAYLASNRAFIIQSESEQNPYGLNPEVAWNFGGSISHTMELDYRPASISLDFFSTQFQNQIVVDLDGSPQAVSFYNLDGRSYANSFQAQFDWEILRHLGLRLAYRYYDVKTTYEGVLLDKPMVSPHRAFINLAYETRTDWKFDATVNWQSQRRLPSTASNPVEYQLSEHSPSYTLVNAQITKSWSEKFEVYVGIENALDFRQEDPILAAEDPFGEYFDGSMTWGPVFGRNTYLGLRYRLK